MIAQYERNRAIAEEVAAGLRTLEDIGVEYGITRERVRQLAKRAGVSRNGKWTPGLERKSLAVCITGGHSLPRNYSNVKMCNACRRAVRHTFECGGCGHSFEVNSLQARQIRNYLKAGIIKAPRCPDCAPRTKPLPAVNEVCSACGGSLVHLSSHQLGQARWNLRNGRTVSCGNRQCTYQLRHPEKFAAIA